MTYLTRLTCQMVALDAGALSHAAEARLAALRGAWEVWDGRHYAWGGAYAAVLECLWGLLGLRRGLEWLYSPPEH